MVLVAWVFATAGCDGTSTTCGEPGQPCCELGTCARGGCCTSGVCTGNGSACPIGGTWDVVERPVSGGSCIDGSCGDGTCGGPGIACCLPTPDSPSRCVIGSDDAACLCTAGALVCGFGGVCGPCGGEREPCCGEGDCGPLAICLDRPISQEGSNVCMPCGGVDQACCDQEACADGLVCATHPVSSFPVSLSKTCQPCGGQGEFCCEDGSQADCGGGCEDAASNVEQCGGCGITCEPGQCCADGQCNCKPGFVLEPGVGCVTAPGSCDCGETGVCDNGVCSAMCPADQTICAEAGVSDRVCVDTTTNQRHCGGCGIECGCDQQCLEGTCR